MSVLRYRLRSRFLDESGVSLVELLVAVMLLTGAFLALAQVATNGLFSLRSAADRTTAMGIATQTVEAGRALEWSSLLMDEDVHAGICGDPVAIDRDGTVTESVLCETDGAVADGLPFWGVDGPYEIETYVTAVPGYGNARRVTAVVTWEERGGSRELRTSTVVAQVARG